jgi:hypothetical protein
VETDEYLRTTADGVWALGDIVGEYLLKHSANHEAQAVVRNVFGDEPEPVDYTAMPFGVFASPEVAGVGATEDDLRAADREYATRVYEYDQTARGSAMHADGFLKVISSLEGEILGCHIIGPEASTLIEEVVVSMTAGEGMVRDIREAVHIHPALSEVVQRGFSGQFTRGGDGGHSHRAVVARRIAERWSGRRSARARDRTDTHLGDAGAAHFRASSTSPELEDESHDSHDLSQAVNDDTAVCDYCLGAFGVEDAVGDAGLVTLDGHDRHPGVRSLVADGYEVSTF